jgi:hypothetical protein
MNEVRESSAKIFINSSNTAFWRGTSTRLSVPIQPFILRSDDPTHFCIGIESLTLPLAIYVVNDTNNLIVIDGLSYYIPSGNYTASSLQVALNTVTSGVVSWGTTFNTTTNKLSATFTGTKVFGGTAQSLLGYTNGSKTSTYTLENTINLAFTTGIIVRLDNIQTENRCPIAGGGSGVLARIPITVSPFKVLQYFNASPFYTTITNRAIQSIDISLLDDTYTPLVLVGDPVWSITLRVDYVDKTSKENVHAMLDKSSRSVLSNKNAYIGN